MENINDIMNHLTELKKWSIAASDPFGQSPADREIKAIASVLKVFGVEWFYDLDSNGKWYAKLKNPV